MTLYYKQPDGSLADYSATDEATVRADSTKLIYNLNGLDVVMTDAEASEIKALWAAYKPPVPQVISDRQFFQQLAVEGQITQGDAMSAVKTGTLPQKLTALVSALPAGQQFSANMILCGATKFLRDHPLVSKLGTAFGWDSAKLDQVWTDASKL